MTINNLGSGKAQNRSYRPIIVLKRCFDIFVPFLTASIKDTLNSANLRGVVENKERRNKIESNFVET